MSKATSKRKAVLMILCEPHTPDSTKVGLDTWMRPMNAEERYQFYKCELKAFKRTMGNRFMWSVNTKAGKRYEERLRQLQDALSEAYAEWRGHEIQETVTDIENHTFDLDGPPNVK